MRGYILRQSLVIACILFASSSRPVGRDARYGTAHHLSEKMAAGGSVLSVLVRNQHKQIAGIRSRRGVQNASFRTYKILQQCTAYNYY